MLHHEYKHLSETLTGEISLMLTSIKDLLMLAEYHQKSYEANNYLSLVSICVMRLQNVTEDVKFKMDKAVQDSTRNEAGRNGPLAVSTNFSV